MMIDNVIFQITIEDLQNEAIERIGRKLTDDEIILRKKVLNGAYRILHLILHITQFLRK